MVKIAPHCQPSGWRHQNHTPLCTWDNDTYVQWGTSGIVVKNMQKVLNDGEIDDDNYSYTTAFFEAFPSNPDTFIRGEGKTIAEAEKNAFEKLIKYKSCSGHEFEKRGYTNGAGFCKHCNLFQSNVFEIETKCIVCQTPSYHTFDKHNNCYCKNCEDLITEDNLSDWQRSYRRQKEWLNERRKNREKNKKTTKADN